jgi:O-antigen/teichoic acid export membrane protein
MTNAPSLSSKAFRGVALLSAKTLIVKVVSVAGQLALAALLTPEDFGLVGLAFSLVAFAAVTRQLGIRETLIHQQGRIRRWSNAAIWFAATLGVASAVLLTMLGPLAAAAWNEPDLIPLVWILAAALPFQTINPALEAHLEVRMRFKEITLIGLVAEITRILLAVALAALGFGAVSFILPRLIVAVGQMIALLRLVRPRLRRSPQTRRWPVFASASGLFFIATLAEIGILQLDYVLLGFVATTAQVGFYFFAFNQSTQIVQLFLMNLVRVLMPGLAAMRNNPQAQVAAFMRTLGLLRLVVVPLGVLQAVVAEPFLRLIFQDRWADAIPLLQILSLAAPFVALAGPASSLFLAQNRLAAYSTIRVLGLAAFLACIGTGAYLTQHAHAATIGVAAGVLVFRAVFNPIACWVACRQGGIQLHQICWLFAQPIIGAGIAAAAAVALDSQLPLAHIATGRPLELLRLILLAAAFTIVFAAWAAIMNRQQIRQAIELLRGLRRRNDRQSIAHA